MLLKRTIIILLAICGCFLRIPDAPAYEIVVVQTSNASYYEKTVRGFMATGVESVRKSGLKSAQPDTVRTYYLNDGEGSELLRRRVMASRPDLILAVGRRALQQVQGLRETPIVYLLAPEAQSLVRGQANITGIEMTISPARQLAAFIEILPAIKKLGVIHDPGVNADFIKEAISMAALHGIVLVAEEAADQKQVPAILARMAGGIDAFWMLPAAAIITPNTVEAMLNFSFANHVPLLTFADKYLELGATVSVGFDLFEMGTQAGRMARRIMSSSPGMIVAAEFPEKVNVQLNGKVADKMGLLVNSAAPWIISGNGG
jgi:putative ABC transport system substrate-binding protein